MRKEWVGGFIAVIAAMTILAAQYTSAAISYKYDVAAEQIIWFGAGDKSTDGIYVLRANSIGEHPYLYFGKLFPGINKTYTAAFAIVNEEKVAIAITGIEITKTTGNEIIYVWLHKTGDLRPYYPDNDPGRNASEISEVNPYWLAAGDGNATTVRDSNGQLYTVNYDPQSNTKVLNKRWEGSDGSSTTQADFVWVLIIIILPPNITPGTYENGIIKISIKAAT